MRTICIDFTASSLGVVGYAGEHNETQLNIAVPTALTDATEYTVEFERLGVKYSSDLLTATDGIVSVELWERLTVGTSGTITIQLVGYSVVDGEYIVIGKSEKVSGTIKGSVSAAESEADRTQPSVISTIIARVTDMWSKVHTHSNKRTLDKLSCVAAESQVVGGFDDNALKFDGRVLLTTAEGTPIGSAEITPNGIILKSSPNLLGFAVQNGDNTELVDRIVIPTASQPTVTDNAVELDFGDAHTHTNKVALDEYNPNLFVGYPAASVSAGSVPIKGASGVVWSPNCSKASQAVTADASIELPAYKLTTLDTSTASADLTVTLSFAAVSDGLIDAYNLRLILCADHTTTLIFPNTVSWLGSEPTFENGKTYDISIVGNLAAWGVVAE